VKRPFFVACLLLDLVAEVLSDDLGKE